MILGIPVFCEPNEVLGKLAQDLGTEEQLKANRIIRREKNKIYQLVIELEDTQLVRKERLLCGYNS